MARAHGNEVTVEGTIGAVVLLLSRRDQCVVGQPLEIAAAGRLCHGPTLQIDGTFDPPILVAQAQDATGAINCIGAVTVLTAVGAAPK